jgi:hypothetical protein
VDAFLVELPSLPLTGWRALGSDAPPVSANLDSGAETFEPVPPYFDQLGVSSANASDGTTTAAALLRAIDLVLYQPRPYLALQENGTYLEQSPPLPINRPWIQPEAQYGAPDFSAGDLPYDTLLIATVFLVSPPGSAPGSPPDGTWQPYVEHAVFWNVDHDTPIPPPGTSQFTLDNPDPGLAGGVGQAIEQGLLDQINAADNAQSGAPTLAGLFWTQGAALQSRPQPGSLAIVPSYGFAKGLRLSAARSVAALQDQAAPLDPPFPYDGLPFDPAFFGISAAPFGLAQH